jgi:hypothetical protein
MVLAPALLLELMVIVVPVLLVLTPMPVLVALVSLFAFSTPAETFPPATGRSSMFEPGIKKENRRKCKRGHKVI